MRGQSGWFVTHMLLLQAFNQMHSHDVEAFRSVVAAPDRVFHVRQLACVCCAQVMERGAHTTLPVFIVL